MVLIRWLELIGVADDIWTKSLQEETLYGTNLVKDALKGWHLSFYHKTLFTKSVNIKEGKHDHAFNQLLLRKCAVELRVELLFRRRHRRHGRNSHFIFKSFSFFYIYLCTYFEQSSQKL